MQCLPAEWGALCIHFCVSFSYKRQGIHWSMGSARLTHVATYCWSRPLVSAGPLGPMSPTGPNGSQRSHRKHRLAAPRWDVDQTMGFNMFKFVMSFLTPPPHDFGSINDSISSQQVLGWATSSPFFCSCWAFSGPAGLYLQKPLIMLKYVVISCGDLWKCSPIWVSS